MRPRGCAAHRDGKPCPFPADLVVQGERLCAEHAEKTLAIVRTRWAVICPIHGRVYLTRAEYDNQMSEPGAVWTCPAWDTDPERFGLCGAEARWDDDTYEAGDPNG